MRILLFGKYGQVGWELQRSLAPLGQIVAPDIDCRELCGDLRNLKGIAGSVRAIAPDVIVNAAAYTAVDKAESEPELAHTINALAPDVLAQEAKRCNARLVHYSTDYVFDGHGDRPWMEIDTASPLNVYGKTKLEGESAVRASGCDHLIFRTSWVYSVRGKNFIRTILRLAQEKNRLRIVDDQIGAPTGAELVADVTAHAIRMVRSPEQTGGVYHLAADGETSWHGLACFVLDRAGLEGIAIKAPPGAVDPVPTSAFPLPAKRPLNSRLDTTKLQRTFGLRLPHWQEGVIRVIHELSHSTPA